MAKWIWPHSNALFDNLGSPFALVDTDLDLKMELPWVFELSGGWKNNAVFLANFYTKQFNGRYRVQNRLLSASWN